MMWKGHVLGMDVDSTGVRMALMESSWGRGPSLKGLACCQDLSEAASMLQQPPWSASSDRICLGFPADKVITRRMILPFTEMQKIKKTLPYEMEGEIPFAAEEVITRFVPLKRSAEGTELLALAFPKAHVSGCLDAVKSYGLDPMVLEPETIALARLARSHPACRNGPVCVLDLGSRRCDLLVMNEAALQHARSLPYGFQGNAHNTSKWLLDELSRTLGALRLKLRLPPIRGLVLCGVGASDETAKWIQGDLGMPVSIMDPLDGLTQHLTDIPLDCMAYTKAVALALHTGKDTLSCNLREGEFAYEPRLSLLRGKAMAALVMLLVAVGLGLADLQVHISSKQRELEAIRSEQRSLFRKVYPGAVQIVDPALQLRRLLERRTQSQVHLLRVDPSTSVLEALREISLRAQANLPLRVKVFDLNGDVISIRGEASAYNVIEKAKERWQGSPLFSEVQVKDAKKNPKTQLWEFHCIARRKSQ